MIGLVIGLAISVHYGIVPFGQARDNKPIPPKITEQLAQTGQAFVEIAKAVTPAVVNISTVIKSPQQTSPFFDDPFFRRFFGDEFREFEPRKRPGLASGVIVSSDGYIVTNNHVVSNAEQIKVLLSDKRELKAKLIGADPKTEIAVIKIDANDLPTIVWSDSDKLQVGEFAIAVGNPFGLNQTVTMGIISAVGRANVGVAEYEDFIQTDAAINPGNSGGALVNIRGELIGVNTAIFSQSGGYQGIGFAVPSNMVKAVMESLIKSGKVVRGWLGVSVQPITSELAQQFGLKDAKGALVSDVVKGSPAEKGGIQRGDVIVSVNGKEIQDSAHLRNTIAQMPVAAKVKVKVVRGKAEKALDIVIAELPKDIAGTGRGMKEEDSIGNYENIFADIMVEDLTPDIARQLNLPKAAKGVVVAGVERGGAAEEGGLRRGDVIEEINKQRINNTKDYKRIALKVKKGEGVLLLINRRGNTFYLTITPE
ncbi:MAG: DegQ family serine endoprotease [Nitrospirae bacterium]|nr:DegQ family serine endoprotease [Nitrospirota bacterium]